MAERLISGDLQQEDQDVSLRPNRLKDFVGQANTKENLSISIQAAKIRHEPLDHVIIYGPPGLGKTTLANIIATEMDPTPVTGIRLHRARESPSTTRLRSSHTPLAEHGQRRNG